jgi:hypothetical protein
VRVGHATGGSEEQTSERRRAGRAVGEGCSKERSETRSVQVEWTPVAKH